MRGYPKRRSAVRRGGKRRSAKWTASVLSAVCVLITCAAGEAFAYSPELVPLAGGTSPVRLPEDEVIGRLYDTSSFRGERERLFETARGFLSSLAGEDREIEEELIDPVNRSALEFSLSSRLENLPIIKEIRYGEIELRGSSGDRRHAVIEVRLLTDGAAAAGELLFHWNGTRWYITGVQIDFGELSASDISQSDILQ